MLRSLFTGLTGLTSQQSYMDVIANNISNVNTTGFKSQSITFADTFSQTLSNAQSSLGSYGGSNPVQVGLGVKIAGISTDFTQGSFESTESSSDMALNGSGYFVVSDGTQDYYTRAGDFEIDDNGSLLGQGGSMYVQGRMADDNGNIASSSALENIVLPYGKKDPAKATDSVTLYCNLNKNASAQEEYTSSSALSLKSGVTGTLSTSTDLNDITGITINAASGPITISGTDATGATVTATFQYGVNGTTLGDLINTVNTAFNSGSSTGATLTLDQNNYLRFTANQSGSSELSLTFTAPTSTDATYATNTAASAYTTGGVAASLTTDLASLDGVTIADGDTITISGTNPDGTAVNATFTYGAANSGTTLQSLISTINTAFGSPVATLDSTGRLVLTDSTSGSGSLTTIALADGTSTGMARAFTAVDGVDATDVDFPDMDESTAGKTGTHSTNITVYDSLGQSHDLAIKFTQDSTPGSNSWTWQATLDNGDIIPTEGGSGAVTFNSDGSLRDFTYDGGATSLKFDVPGAQNQSIAFDTGTIGGFDGMTQFASTSTTVAIDQNGHTMGKLSNISVDDEGIITGNYSNGQSRVLAQVGIAQFVNQEGLQKEGSSLYTETSASGSAEIGWAGVNNSTAIKSGYLEQSNVDLTTQFADMIIAERAIQANAKVISSSDNILTTIINNVKRS